MRQRLYVELLSDYDCKIKYHLRKANVVADALSRKEQVNTIRVRALGMTIRSHLTTQILQTHVEALKEPDLKEESLRGMEKQLEIKLDEIRYFMNLM